MNYQGTVGSVYEDWLYANSSSWCSLEATRFYLLFFLRICYMNIGVFIYALYIFRFFFLFQIDDVFLFRRFLCVFWKANK